MKTSILIVTCARHFPWMEYCLKSIAKYARDFHEVALVLPSQEPLGDVNEMIDRHPGPVPLRVILEPEWPGKGMLWHEWMIVKSDLVCPESDFILHTDSDCVFTQPVTPQDYFVDGKPVLMYASYEWLCKQQTNIRNWQVATENALGGIVENEFMRRHPAVHYREVYARTRQAIEDRNRMRCEDYIKSCRNEFPQGFAEFPTLGEIAWRQLREQYHWINQETEPFPPEKLHQFWSHRVPSGDDLVLLDKFGLR